jgi:membrane protein required for colicin V production
MNGLDIAFAVVLLFFLLRGIFRGFIKEITSIVAVIIGFIVACRSYPAMAEILKPFIQNPAYRQSIGFIILFFAVFIVASLLVLDRLFKVALSKAANSMLGALVAIIKGVLLSAVVLMVATSFISQDSTFFQDSVSWPYLRYMTESFKNMVPEDLKKAIENRKDEMPDQLKPFVPDLSGGGAQEPPPWKPAIPRQPAEPVQPAWPGSLSSDPGTTDENTR